MRTEVVERMLKQQIKTSNFRVGRKASLMQSQGRFRRCLLFCGNGGCVCLSRQADLVGANALFTAIWAYTIGDAGQRSLRCLVSTSALRSGSPALLRFRSRRYQSQLSRTLQPLDPVAPFWADGAHSLPRYTHCHDESTDLLLSGSKLVIRGELNG